MDMDAASTPTSQASAPASTARLPAARSNRVLACQLCQHRKIKCDRHFPCANCRKAHVQCIPSTPAPARKRKRPNQDLQERLARCEEILRQHSLTDDRLWHPTGRLVRQDGSETFVNNHLGGIFEEIRAMREILDAEDSDDDSPGTTTPDINSEMVFALDGATAPRTTVVWPEPDQIAELWQIYRQRVNPLAKIIHVPTLEPDIRRAAYGPNAVPKNIEALLYSIFLMAVVALTADECLDKLGHSREEAIQMYSEGVRSALTQMNFLTAYDFTSLQALVLYLMSLQGRSSQHSAWIMNGIALRIAQKMGLHRDGENFGLSPFDSEMRRRLWWVIVMLDSKYAVFSGLSQPIIVHRCTTKAPTNIDDEDMDPQATEPFRDRDGPTDMIFTLMMHKFAKFFMENPGFDALIFMSSESAPNGPTQEQKAEYRIKVDRLRKDLLAIMFKYSSPAAGPVHEMAHSMRQHIDGKLQELLVDPDAQPGLEGEVRNESDNTFRIAVTGLEHDCANFMVVRDKGFLWFAMVHFQFDLVLYMAGQLCVRTEGNLVERAWAQLEAVYNLHPELYDIDNRRCRNLGRYVLKAWRKRDGILRARGNSPHVPIFVEKLRSRILDSDTKAEPTPPDPSSELYTVPANLGVMSGFGGFLLAHDTPQTSEDMSHIGVETPCIAQEQHVVGGTSQSANRTAHITNRTAPMAEGSAHPAQKLQHITQLTPHVPQNAPHVNGGTPHTTETVTPISNSMVIDTPPPMDDFLDDSLLPQFPIFGNHPDNNMDLNGQGMADDFDRFFGAGVDGLYHFLQHHG
ncbi:hypothetical protein VTI74DRAFT_5844 [Chaetomium olivicolor]